MKYKEHMKVCCSAIHGGLKEAVTEIKDLAKREDKVLASKIWTISGIVIDEALLATGLFMYSAMPSEGKVRRAFSNQLSKKAEPAPSP